MQPIPYPNDAPDEIWLQLARWSQRYLCLKVWTDGWKDGRRPISLFRAFRSGELKNKALSIVISEKKVLKVFSLKSDLSMQKTITIWTI